ncbi:hypothetical protein [Thermosphaera sp.]
MSQDKAFRATLIADSTRPREGYQHTIDIVKFIANVIGRFSSRI